MAMWKIRLAGCGLLLELMFRYNISHEFCVLDVRVNRFEWIQRTTS